MIKNDRQYRITRAQAVKFEEALQQLEAAPADQDELHPLLRTAQREALESQLADLVAQLEEYEALQAGSQVVLEVESLAALPRALIQGRIA
ncbi:MAG: hypothetical protein ACRDIB_18390, partial [Ardenticatenaceae bacterium]